MDIVEAGAKYNIFEYQRDFEKAYADIRSRGGVLCPTMMAQPIET